MDPTPSGYRVTQPTWTGQGSLGEDESWDGGLVSPRGGLPVCGEAARGLESR